jgi:hypothetical protein
VSLSITVVSLGIRRSRVVTAAAEAAHVSTDGLLGGLEDGLVEDLGRPFWGAHPRQPTEGPLYGLWRSRRARPSDLSRISVVLRPASEGQNLQQGPWPTLVASA